MQRSGSKILTKENSIKLTFGPPNTGIGKNLYAIESVHLIFSTVYKDAIWYKDTL